jgi:hypothetical protein
VVRALTEAGEPESMARQLRAALAEVQVGAT